MKLTIYGASDDVLDVESDTGYSTEFDVSGKWVGFVTDPEGYSLRITAEFSARGRRTADWTLGIENTDEWPEDWTIRFGYRPGDDFDPAIILEVPDGTVVESE